MYQKTFNEYDLSKKNILVFINMTESNSEFIQNQNLYIWKNQLGHVA